MAASNFSVMSASGRLRVQRFRKDFIVKMMTRQLEGKNFVAVAYTGNINYHQQYTLRSDLNAAGASFNIVKNSLMALGFERAGFEPLKPLLRGKVAIASGDADVAIAKTLLSLSKKVRICGKRVWKGSMRKQQPISLPIRSATLMKLLHTVSGT